MLKIMRDGIVKFYFPLLFLNQKSVYCLKQHSHGKKYFFVFLVVYWTQMLMLEVFLIPSRKHRDLLWTLGNIIDEKGEKLAKSSRSISSICKKRLFKRDVDNIYRCLMLRSSSSYLTNLWDFLYFNLVARIYVKKKNKVLNLQRSQTVGGPG